jgi:hypothetical protein
VHLVVPGDHDVVEVDVDGNPPDAVISHITQRSAAPALHRTTPQARPPPNPNTGTPPRSSRPPSPSPRITAAANPARTRRHTTATAAGTPTATPPHPTHAAAAADATTTDRVVAGAVVAGAVAATWSPSQRGVAHAVAVGVTTGSPSLRGRRPPGRGRRGLGVAIAARPSPTRSRSAWPRGRHRCAVVVGAVGVTPGSPPRRGRRPRGRGHAVVGAAAVPAVSGNAAPCAVRAPSRPVAAGLLPVHRRPWGVLDRPGPPSSTGGVANRGWPVPLLDFAARELPRRSRLSPRARP